MLQDSLHVSQVSVLVSPALLSTVATPSTRRRGTSTRGMATKSAGADTRYGDGLSYRGERSASSQKPG